jgi:4-hydroxybenzoate polyprenyltransferase
MVNGDLEGRTARHPPRPRHRLLPLMRAAHAQPTVAVTAITTTLAVAAGRGWQSIWVAAAVLSGQLSVGWSNDGIERERDRRVGRADKPLVAGEVAPSVVAMAAVAALVACGPLSLLSGWRAALVHLGAVAAAWAYNLGLKATVVSALPYAAAFGALPAFVTLGLAGHPWPPRWSMLAAASLGAGAHFVNALPDLDADLEVGVRGLPQRLGRRRSLVAGTSLLATSAALVALSAPGSPGAVTAVLLIAAVLVLLAVLGTAASGRDRAAWTLTLVAAALTVALFLIEGGSLAPDRTSAT